mmetsp:Transcript_2017/g.7248  ORF Transcript_2017/g.7248 Transcript_2017/m.7248 type:complete len:113 (-) Transcript_2017:342-680(-)
MRNLAPVCNRAATAARIKASCCCDDEPSLLSPAFPISLHPLLLVHQFAIINDHVSLTSMIFFWDQLFRLSLLTHFTTYYSPVSLPTEPPLPPSPPLSLYCSLSLSHPLPSHD